MNIGIVTVYDAVSNIGSYLQAYAMKLVLEDMGHQVFFLEKTSVPSQIWAHIRKLNPKRSFFLRLQSGLNYWQVSREFSFIQPEQAEAKLDALLFGSDEIWNLDNPYFADPLFFGQNSSLPKAAYAVSAGAMTLETTKKYGSLLQQICRFQRVLVRDDRTWELVRCLTGSDSPLVCDPTMLVDISRLSTACSVPKKPYILVYSYGLDPPMIDHIRRFAAEKELQIVSAHFWHHFCHRTIPCKPLQFGPLMAQAEYVFTSTFHGAVFAMCHHTRCCILPVREKVRDVVLRMGQSNRLIAPDDNYQRFKTIISQPFPTEEFETGLRQWRAKSAHHLQEALVCLQESSNI